MDRYEYVSKLPPEYWQKLEEAARYQDFVTDRLMCSGIALNCYSSLEYQFGVGESASGIEVKYDRRLHETGNVYIEVAERSSTDSGFVPSGVFREDNSWLFLIGDYDRALLLSKKHAKMLLAKPDEELESLGIRKYDKETSQGYVIAYEPLSRSSCCLKAFDFGGDDK